MGNKKSKNVVSFDNNIFHKFIMQFNLVNTKIEDEEDIKKPIFFGMLDYIYSFTGRKDDMNRVHKSVTQNMLTVISGFGGIGKTELVRFYAWKHRTLFNNNVVWINAATELSLKDCFDKLAIELRIPIQMHGSSRSEDAIIRHIYDVLNDRKCLIVFDNAENRKEIRTYLPQKRDSNISVIITSRNQDWGTVSVIPLSVLKPEEACEFLETYLQKSCNIAENKIWIEELANKLQYLPLALQQAVACINYKILDLNEEFGVRQYIEQFEKKKMINYTFQKNNPFPESDENSYDKTLLQSVALSVNFIKNCDLYADLTLDILHFVSYLSPNNIPKKIFDSMETNVDKLNTSLHTLTKYSLIQKIKIEDQVYYNIHRLVQLSYRFIKNPEDGFCPETAKTVLSSTSKNLIFYIQHFIAVVDLIMEDKNHDLKFYFKLGIIRKTIDYRVIFYYTIKQIKNILASEEISKKINEKYLQVFEIILSSRLSINGSTYIFTAEDMQEPFVQILLENNIQELDDNIQEIFNMELNEINNLKKFDNNTSLVLFKSSVLGDLKMIQYLNNMRIDIDKPIGPDYTTPLFIAASYGQKDVVQYLVENKCHINFSTSLGVTPLYIASEVGNLEIVQYLIKKGADVTKVPTNLTTPLHTASHQGHKDIVEYFVKNIYDVNILDKEKNSPLFYAIQNGHLSTVEFLVENGANVNQQNIRGYAPIHIASETGYLEIIEVLVEYNCDVNIVSKEGISPLYFASLHGHLNIVQYLLKNNADICQCSEAGYSPFSAAIKGGHLDIIRFLLKNKCNIELNTTIGQEALSIADLNWRSDIFKFLKDNNVLIDESSHKMICFEYNDIRRYLDYKRSYVKANASDGWGTVDIVYRTGLYFIVQYLFKKSKYFKEVYRQCSVRYLYILFSIIILIIYMYI